MVLCLFVQPVQYASNQDYFEEIAAKSQIWLFSSSYCLSCGKYVKKKWLILVFSLFESCFDVDFFFRWKVLKIENRKMWLNFHRDQLSCDLIGRNGGFGWRFDILCSFHPMLCSPVGCLYVQVCPLLDIIFLSLLLHALFIVPLNIVLPRPDELETCPWSMFSTLSNISSPWVGLYSPVLQTLRV